MRQVRPYSRTIGLVGLVVAATGCDSTATIYQQRVTFQYAQVVSAFPAKKKTDNTWERVCDGGPMDGLVTNMVLVSSLRKPEAGSDVTSDRDQGIRPKDTIEQRVVSDPASTAAASPGDIRLQDSGNMSLQLDCIDPVPTTNPASCQGASPGQIGIDSVRYIANNKNRATGNNVMILIDQSGSVGGLVNRVPDAAKGEDWIAYSEDQLGRVNLAQNVLTIASDGSDTRVSIARKLALDLNDQDRFGALAFGEGDGISSTMIVPCTDATGAVNESLKACFGKRNREIWTGANGIEKLKNNEGGRSNLWQALQTAYRFLRDEIHDTDRSNHIIVVTDGPDTCAPGENLGGACFSSCSTVDYDAVRTEIMTDNALPNAPRIHVHFVQFESKGYVGRDPRQVETSCLTGGHYQFVNTESFPHEQQSYIDGALQTALNNVRYSLMGHWEVGATVPSYADSGPTGTRVGSLYALAGIVTIRASSHLVTTDRQIPFGIGQGGGTDTSLPPMWDRRPSVRKPCGSAADCGGADGECQIVCSAESNVCRSGATGVKAPDNFACETTTGAAGFCCSDVAGCQANGSPKCTTCEDAP